MALHLKDSAAKCQACARRGHCRGANCHRCRIASLQKLYATLLRLGDLTADLQKAILWYVYEHPDIAFKIKVANLSALNASAKLRGPGFVQLRRE